MHFYEGTGFRYLTPQEQQAYRVMLKAFSQMATSFDSTQIHPSIDLMKVLNAVLGDNPTVIYFDGTKLEVENSFFGKKIFLTGVHPKPQAEQMGVTLDLTANRIASIVKSRSNDEYSLLLNLYEAIQNNIRYDKDEIQANSRGVSKNSASHNAYGALVNRLAVCDGFSSAFTLLAQKLGFECMLVVGRSAYATTLQDHAWNIIKIGGKYYHMDATWDARKYADFNEYSYAYFAVSDQEISSDHNWNSSATPVCSNNDFNYYLKNGLYASNTEHLNKIIKALGSQNTNVIRLKLSRNIKLPNNAGEYLMQITTNEVIKPGERKQVGYSWSDRTRCFFAKIM